MIGLNIEMPKNCKECPLEQWYVDENAFVCGLNCNAECKFDGSERPKECPLIEIKEVR